MLQDIKAKDEKTTKKKVLLFSLFKDMGTQFKMIKDAALLKQRYLELLAKDYPNRFAAFTEIINLQAILNLPKGTEHFISDIHGEYSAFNHIINNCSGVIRDKIKLVFKDFSKDKRTRLCTLIYYPHEELESLKHKGVLNADYYREAIKSLIILATFLSSKYTRSKVRKAIGDDFGFIIDELMHAKSDEDNNRLVYHEKILSSIIETGNAEHFIEKLAAVIKRLAVDHLHVLGDVFDRGCHPEKCFDILMNYHSIDFQWGNHDILWMGAYLGNVVCATTAVRNNVKYDNYAMLENGYGISLRKLALFAKKTYKDEKDFSAMDKAISIICLKLQGNLILKHPEYNMRSRMMLEYINLEKGTISLNGQEYELKTQDLPTIDPNNPYKLTKEELEVANNLRDSFMGSQILKKHAEFLFNKGSMYKCYNGNLLYHGCIPLREDGSFASILCNGRYLEGKAYLDYCESRVREAYTNKDSNAIDFMWYLWCGATSPLSGRIMKTSERVLIKDPKTWEEPRNPYYVHYYNENTCKMILREFSLNPETGHIINGHTPIKVKDGETPIRGNGKLLVIDGGFCKAYQKTTGIAGYTLIYNSHNLRLKAHTPFTTLDDALENFTDIDDEIILVETFNTRRMVANCDCGEKIKHCICDLKDLVLLYKNGVLSEKF